MLNISEFSLAVSIEILMILLMLVSFLVYLVRVKNKEIEALKASVKGYKGVSPTSLVENYLTGEIESIACRVDTLSGTKNSQNDEFSEADFLELRKSVLEIEKELLARKNNTESFWSDMGDKIKSVLSLSYLRNSMEEIETKEKEEDPNYKKNNFNRFGSE